MALSKLNDKSMARFLKHKPGLEIIIKHHLPGNFSKWEKDHTTWNGSIKTVDGIEPDPRAYACALQIFTAYILGEESLGFANKKSDLEALDDLRRALILAKKSIENLSMDASFQLHEDSSDSFGSSLGVPPILLVDPLIDAFLKATLKTKTHVKNEGSENSRQNRIAASVAEACQDVFSARTGRRAATYVRDEVEKKNEGKLAPLAMFIKDVFTELEINSRADSALTALRTIRN